MILTCSRDLDLGKVSTQLLSAAQRAGRLKVDNGTADLQQVLLERKCKTADAIAAPSTVEVPLPSSSSATRLRHVARLRAAAVSVSSTKKVDCSEEHLVASL